MKTANKNLAIIKSSYSNPTNNKRDVITTNTFLYEDFNSPLWGGIKSFIGH